MCLCFQHIYIFLQDYYFKVGFFGSVFPPLTYFVLFFNLYIVSLLHQIF